MKQFLIAVLLTLGVFSSFAKNIQPVENVGRVVVNLPDISSFAKTVQDEYLSKFQKLSFRNQTIQPGVEYFVDAGQGCATLSFNSGYVFTGEICGNINPGQLVTLNFTALHLEWDAANLKTDVGPSANFFILTNLGTPVSSTSSALDTNYISKNLFIGKPGNYKSVFYVANTTDVIDEKAFTLSTPVSINVTPKDIREEITVQFLNGPEKFSFSGTNAAYVIFRERAFTEVGKTLLPGYKTPYGSIGSILNYSRLVPQTTPYKLNYFPVEQTDQSTSTSQWILEVVVNETQWPLSFKKGQKQVVPIEIINVNDFQTGKSGVFNFARKDTKASGTTQWTPILTSISSYGDLILNNLPTSASLLLLPGYEYLFEFFIQDDLGKLLKQDTVILDLK